MSFEEKFIAESLEEAFSTLPSEQTVSQTYEIVEKYLNRDEVSIDEIRWGEFDLIGKFVRGGLTKLDSLTSVMITNTDGDPIYKEIIDRTKFQEIKAGSMAASDSTDGFLWCVPYRPVSETGKIRKRFRVLLLTENIVGEVLEMLNTGSGVTPSEKKVVFQIITGQSVKSAAKADNLSSETKRSQLKSALSKLDCRTQAELVRLTITQLIHLLYLCESETSNLQIVEKFHSSFVENIGRLSVQRLSNGSVMRFWEFGPRNGRLVLAMHGYLFPFLFLDSLEHLVRNNVRLVLPIRPGFLEKEIPVENLEQAAHETISSLLCFADEIRSDRMTVLGHNLGAAYALILASRRPDLFDTVIIASMNLLKKADDSSTVASKFARGMKRLAGRSELYQFVTRQFRSVVVGNSGMAKFVLNKLYRDSQADLAVINGKNGSKPAYDWFGQIAVNSVSGGAVDLDIVSNMSRYFVDEMPLPTTFIHGSQDPFTTKSELVGFAEKFPISTVEIIDQGGHYVSASHADRFWQEVGKAVRN